MAISFRDVFRNIRGGAVDALKERVESVQRRATASVFARDAAKKATDNLISSGASNASKFFSNLFKTPQQRLVEPTAGAGRAPDSTSGVNTGVSGKNFLERFFDWVAAFISKFV